ncbi:LuxR family transcriptional regulator [Bradyrhizobium sp. 14AA]
MHKIFQRFIDAIENAEDTTGFFDAMAVTAAALDLTCFAYLALSRGSSEPRLISTYPTPWTSHYLKNSYERIDPVIVQALNSPEPFKWGGNTTRSHSMAERQLLDEACEFGIRFGFTVPVHDGHGPIAALTFAGDQQNAPFERCVDVHGSVLQLLAMYFHAHVRRKLTSDHSLGRIGLSPREFECLVWASRGKSAWEIGRILSLSRNTVAYYLENAKKKLGVRTIAQAVARLAAANKTKQN